jgi:hypothetical protein
MAAFLLLEGSFGQVADTLSTTIPSFTDRLNFALPLIVLLLILMLFLMLKSYESERSQ